MKPLRKSSLAKLHFRDEKKSRCVRDTAADKCIVKCAFPIRINYTLLSINPFLSRWFVTFRTTSADVPTQTKRQACSEPRYCACTRNPGYSRVDVTRPRARLHRIDSRQASIAIVQYIPPTKNIVSRQTDRFVFLSPSNGIPPVVTGV